jgi:hypothetical protein
LKKKPNAIRIQQTVVPWLIAMFGIDYIAQVSPEILRQMIAVVVKKENLKGLGHTYDKLAEEYPHTVTELAERAKYAAGSFLPE